MTKLSNGDGTGNNGSEDEGVAGTALADGETGM